MSPGAQSTVTRAPVSKEKKNHYICSSQPRADQMPGPPWEGQLMCTHVLARINEASNINDVILPHEKNHGITNAAKSCAAHKVCR